MPQKQQDGRRTSIGAKRNAESTTAIVEAATALLEREGYGAFSIDKVARIAAAGKPTIYRWWRTRSDLLVDVFRGCPSKQHAVTNDLRMDLTNYTTAVFQDWQHGVAAEAARGIIAEAQIDRSTRGNVIEVLFPSLVSPIRSMLLANRVAQPNGVFSDVKVAEAERAWFSAALSHLICGPPEPFDRDIAAVVEGVLSHLSPRIPGDHDHEVTD